MLRAALREAGLAWDAFSVVPLPVNVPELYRHYVPMDAVFFLTIYDDWGRAKLQRFQDLGLRVEVMWERPPEEKGICGEHVRGAMLDGGDWRALVPAGVARLVDAWNLPERLRKMDAQDRR
jgi:nicotinamide-nucleotide adenylyltransferase